MKAQVGVKPRNTKDFQPHQKLGERHGTDSPSQPSIGTNSADTLISGFQPPGL